MRSLQVSRRNSENCDHLFRNTALAESRSSECKLAVIRYTRRHPQSRQLLMSLGQPNEKNPHGTRLPLLEIPVNYLSIQKQEKFGSNAAKNPNHRPRG